MFSTTCSQQGYVRENIKKINKIQDFIFFVNKFLRALSGNTFQR